MTSNILNWIIFWGAGQLAIPVFIIYFVASLTPLFISSVQRTFLLGVLLFLSAAATVLFFVQYLTSAWCFFAAFISGIILWILSGANRNSSFEQQSVELKLQ